jgi:hypothetical protein
MNFQSVVNSDKAWKEGTVDIAQIYEKPIIKIDNWKVWSVYGDYVMLKMDMDFVIAGNPYAKKYIPENEIWIDRMVAKDDLVFVMIHEISESIIMRDLGYTYEKAHRIANEIEYKARIKHYEDRQAQKSNAIG